jgi:thioesterase domain-containing protein
MRPLAMALDQDLPFYCLQHKGLDGSDPFGSVEEAARCYVDEIRKVQPHGPYHLGGYCFGGVVAFEMARMLEQLGEHVASLFLIDGFNPAYLRFQPTREMLLRLGRFYVRRAVLHSRRMRSLRPAMWPSYTGERLKAIYVHARRFVKKVANAKGDQFPSDPRTLELEQHAASDLEEILEALRRASRGARRNFVPRPYGGDAVVFRASERNDDPYEDYFLGWRPVVRGSMQSIEIDSTHESIFRDPAVRLIAEKLCTSLKESSADAKTEPALYASAR